MIEDFACDKVPEFVRAAIGISDGKECLAAVQAGGSGFATMALGQDDMRHGLQLSVSGCQIVPQREQPVIAV